MPVQSESMLQCLAANLALKTHFSPSVFGRTVQVLFSSSYFSYYHKSMKELRVFFEVVKRLDKLGGDWTAAQSCWTAC